MVDPSPKPLVIQLELPDELLQLDADELSALPERVRLLVLVDLVRRRKIGPNRGARLAGLGILEFYRVLAEHKVPTMDLDPEEFQEELDMIADERTAS